jgi:hypothetical protein
MVHAKPVRFKPPQCIGGGVGDKPGGGYAGCGFPDFINAEKEIAAIGE